MQGLILRIVIAVLTFVIGNAITALVDRVAGPKRDLQARQVLLKQDLSDFRKMIDRYTADKQNPPAALDDLVKANYTREIPVDPITGKRDWVVETGSVLVLRDTGKREWGPEIADMRDKRQGIVNVHSNASG